MYLVKLDNGYYAPMYNKDKEESDKIAIGSEVKATKSRNARFHRKAFALLNMGFNNQDKFAEFEIYRKVNTIKAGYYDEVKSKRGVEYMPKSLSYDKMSAEDFEKWFEDTLLVISQELQTAPEEIQNELSNFY